MQPIASETIDVTPTWAGTVPWITAGLEAGGTAHSSALHEMYRMAEAADKWNANAAGMLAALQHLVFDCEAHGLGDNDAHLREARAAIARARGE